MKSSIDHDQCSSCMHMSSWSRSRQGLLSLWGSSCLQQEGFCCQNVARYLAHGMTGSPLPVTGVASGNTFLNCRYPAPFNIAGTCPLYHRIAHSCHVTCDVHKFELLHFFVYIGMVLYVYRDVDAMHAATLRQGMSCIPACDLFTLPLSI